MDLSTSLMSIEELMVMTTLHRMSVICTSGERCVCVWVDFPTSIMKHFDTRAGTWWKKEEMCNVIRAVWSNCLFFIYTLSLALAPHYSLFLHPEISLPISWLSSAISVVLFIHIFGFNWFSSLRFFPDSARSHYLVGPILGSFHFVRWFVFWKDCCYINSLSPLQYVFCAAPISHLYGTL